MPKFKITRYLIISALLIKYVPIMAGDLNCNMELKRIDGGYGPYDYSNPTHRADRWPIVRSAHFNNITEQMALQGRSDRSYMNTFATKTGHRKQTPIEGDLHYTLRAFPNQPRALNAISVFQMKRKHNNMYFTADCFFQRAIKFTPNDPKVRMVYGIHFFRHEKYEEALEQFKISEKLVPNSAETEYNIGLTYLKLENRKMAQAYADKAYSKGYPLKGLRNGIEKMVSPK